eukprot:XP_025012158.1 uncharacterized protein LOC112533910 [Ricinus communis]
MGVRGCVAFGTPYIIRYFIYLVDHAIFLIESRFEQFKKYGNFSRKKFFKIKINKILFMFNHVTRKD